MTRQNTPKQIFGTHPVSGQSRKFVYVYVFFLWAYPQYGWDFPEEIPEKLRKDPGNALSAFPGISLESTAGMPQTL